MENNVLSRAGVAIVVGIITWIVLAFIGMLVSKYLDGDIGGFISSISVLFGILATVWYFLTNRRLV